MASHTKSSDVRCGQLNYSELIEAVMKARGVSINRLYQDHVIRKCSTRNFHKKLTAGHISAAELNQLLAYLGINPVRAALALACLCDPQAYFEPSCETASVLAEETAVVLTQQVSACDGNFEPIKDSICRSLARKTSGMIIEHHNRVEEFRTAAFG